MGLEQLTVDYGIDSLVEALAICVSLARLFDVSLASFLLNDLMETLQAREWEIWNTFLLVCLLSRLGWQQLLQLFKHLSLSLRAVTKLFHLLFNHIAPVCYKSLLHGVVIASWHNSLTFETWALHLMAYFFQLLGHSTDISDLIEPHLGSLRLSWWVIARLKLLLDESNSVI